MSKYVCMKVGLISIAFILDITDPVDPLIKERDQLMHDKEIITCAVIVVSALFGVLIILMIALLLICLIWKRRCCGWKCWNKHGWSIVFSWVCLESMWTVILGY